MAETNLVSQLSEDDQKKLAMKVCHWVTTDLQDRTAWEDRQDQAFKLWACDPGPRKGPWPDSANVCIPVIASAVNNWAGLTNGAMTENPYPERVQVIPAEANDINRAERAQKCMNWQIVFEMGAEYEDSYDRLLPDLAITGTAFKKVTWDDDRGGPKTEHVSALDVIVPNDTKCLDKARRITHRLRQHIDEIKELGEEGFYANTEGVGQTTSGSENQPNPRIESEKEFQGFESVQGESNQNVVWECHFRGKLPIEGDQPKNETRRWIAWVDNRSGVVLRLVAAPKKIPCMFADYHFIPSPNGEFYSYGFGHWLEPLNRVMNAVFNQYIDAGRLTNSPAVFHGRSVGLRGREIKIAPGKGIPVDDVTQLLITKFPALDQNLPLILQFLKEYASDITANTDEIQGRVQKGVREPTVRGQASRLDRSMSRFKVFAKRVFRGQSKELGIIFDMNSVMLDEEKQYVILGSNKGLAFGKTYRKDFDKRLHLLPTADPDFASPERRRSEAFELYQLALAEFQLTAQGAQGTIDALALSHIRRDLFMTYGKTDIVRYLPQIDQEPYIDPFAENMLFAQGDETPVKQQDNDVDHIREHRLFMDTTTFQKMPAKAQDALEEHIRGHIMQYQIKQQLAAQQAAMAQAQQGGEQAVQ